MIAKLEKGKAAAEDGILNELLKSETNNLCLKKMNVGMIGISFRVFFCEEE